MTHEDDKYDLVWACESGEHMPDKKRYVEEMTRVLKPGTVLNSSAPSTISLCQSCLLSIY